MVEETPSIVVQEHEMKIKTYLGEKILDRIMKSGKKGILRNRQTCKITWGLHLKEGARKDVVLHHWFMNYIPRHPNVAWRLL